MIRKLLDIARFLIGLLCLYLLIVFFEKSPSPFLIVFLVYIIWYLNSQAKLNQLLSLNAIDRVIDSLKENDLWSKEDQQKLENESYEKAVDEYKRDRFVFVWLTGMLEKVGAFLFFPDEYHSKEKKKDK
jgi:hypothetical protein